MANPSYWTFRRRKKWHSGWRDEAGQCHSKVHPIGVGKALAQEYARKMAIEACQVRAGQAVAGKDIRSALQAFLTRQNVKENTHELNRRHLNAVVEHFRLQNVGQLNEELMNEWLGYLKSNGNNPGGQSLSLRILRSFCRFCIKRRWLSVYPFESFKIPRSEFVGQYLSGEQRDRLLSINPRYDIDRHLNRALTFGLYSLLRISQVFNADWTHVKEPDQLWVPGIKGQDGRWITLHPKAIGAMGEYRDSGRIFDRWETLEAFREAVYKKAKREKLRGVRFHETKHTGISALLEAGYSIPEVCRISGNSYRTIAHYAHVSEQRVFEKWKAFEYGGAQTVQQMYSKKRRKKGQKRLRRPPMVSKAKVRIASNSRQVFDLRRSRIYRGVEQPGSSSGTPLIAKNQRVFAYHTAAVQQLPTLKSHKPYKEDPSQI